MAITRHFSAGGIVIKKEKGEIKILVTQHSKHKGWDFPKGHLNEGESSQDAALREVEEETGIKGELIKKAGQTQYFFHDKGEKIFKTVNYFFMKYSGEGEAITAWEVGDIKWLPVEKVESRLSFKSTKEMWSNARKKIHKF